MVRAMVVAAFAALLLPGAAQGSGKCGDDPYKKGSKLWVAWVVPVPRSRIGLWHDDDDARAAPSAQRARRDQLRSQAAAHHPYEVGEASESDATSAAVLASYNALEGFYKSIGIVENPARSPLLQAAFLDYDLYVRLVRHPDVKVPRSFKICSCTAARVVVVYDGPERKETLYVKNLFQSAQRDGPDSKQFEPAGLTVEFARESSILVPLRFLSLSHTATTLSIDVLTDGVTAGPFPAEFLVEVLPDVRIGDRTYRAQRASMMLAPAPLTGDLVVPVR